MIEKFSMSNKSRGNRSKSSCGRPGPYDPKGRYWYDLLYKKAERLKGHDLIQICSGVDIDSASKTVWVNFSYVFNPQGNLLQRAIFKLTGLFHKPKGGFKMQRRFGEEAKLKVENDVLYILENNTCLSDDAVIEFAHYTIKTPNFPNLPKYSKEDVIDGNSFADNYHK